MAKAEALAQLVTALGGTPSGATVKELLGEAVTALGGTPSGDSIADLIAEIASAYGEAIEDLAAGNIKKGVTILGVTGTYEGEGGGK